MLRHLLYGALVTAAVAAPTLIAQQRVRPDAVAAGPGVISGRLTAADTRAALRGAEVTAMRMTESGVLIDPAGQQTVMTDDDGRFAFTGLRLGTWKVTASRTGYIPWQFGQRRPFQSPPPIELSPGRERMVADFILPRASAIAGRVYDESGEPVMNARVTAYRARMRQGRRQLEPVGHPDQSDDTGGFRIYGLAPGQYYVAASLRVAPADSIVDTTYAPTYYPGTGNLAEAQRITLQVGGEAFAGFQLLPVRRLRITGSVFTSGGAPARAFLTLVSEAAEHGVPLGMGGATRSDGTFTLPDVAPGRYTLFASLREDAPGESAEIPLTVGFDDVTGLTLVTAPAASIRGTFVADAGVTRPLPQGIGVTAHSYRTGGPTTAGTVSGRTFEIAGPGGPFFLEFHDVPPGWMVKRIEIAGLDATDAPVDLRSQQDASARIVLTDRLTEVSGTLGDRGAAGLTVVVFPEQPAAWARPSRYIRTAVTDTRGRFRVDGLPAGRRYLAVAVDYLEEAEGEDPDFLSSVAGGAASFALAEGQRLTIAAPVIFR